MKYIFSLLAFCLFSPVFTAKADNTVSIIIPCHHKHVQHLYPLLKLYEEQTELPDEVVISISGADQIEEGFLEILQDELWLFPVKLLVTKEKLWAGQNRNKACQNAIGDILITQDADDLPHPQRIEVIKYCFAKYDIDHILHQYIGDCYARKNGFLQTTINIDDVQVIFPDKYKDIWDMKYVANGNIAIHRRVLEHVQWTSAARGQDVEFNTNVYKALNRTMGVQTPLSVYRFYLSTYQHRGG